MAGTAGITAEILGEIEKGIEESIQMWERGEATSPDTRDFVLITEGVIEKSIGPEYLWLGEDTRESVSERLFEMQQDGETLQTPSEMAAWLAGAVTVGTEDES